MHSHVNGCACIHHHHHHDHRVLVSPRYARVLVVDVESRFSCILVFLTSFQGLEKIFDKVVAGLVNVGEQLLIYSSAT